jgi:tyrosinase
MVNVALSPGDPIFFLHHAYIDKIWWEWQELDLEARLVDMSGTNQPRSGGGPGGGGPGGGGSPGLKLRAETFDYGDPGNETTLSHILGMVDIFPDAIIAEVMDLRGDLICAEYLD